MKPLLKKTAARTNEAFHLALLCVGVAVISLAIVAGQVFALAVIGNVLQHLAHIGATSMN